jgi:hypothetical protein
MRLRVIGLAGAVQVPFAAPEAADEVIETSPKHGPHERLKGAGPRPPVLNRIICGDRVDHRHDRVLLRVGQLVGRQVGTAGQPGDQPAEPSIIPCHQRLDRSLPVLGVPGREDQLRVGERAQVGRMGFRWTVHGSSFRVVQKEGPLFASQRWQRNCRETTGKEHSVGVGGDSGIGVWRKLQSRQTPARGGLKGGCFPVAWIGLAFWGGNFFTPCSRS